MLRRCMRLGALALFLAAPAIHAQSSFVFMGGLSAPMSDLGDITDMGYNVGAGLNLGLPAIPFGLRFEVGYNSFNFNNTISPPGDTRIITGTVNGIFSLGPTSNAPYVIAGVGAYNRNFSTNFSNGNSAYGSGNTVLGINGGGGFRFGLSGFSTFVEARYHVMFGDQASGSNYQFIPVTFGVQF